MQLDWLWGYLMPIGLLLLIWSGLPPRRARQITPLAFLTMALAMVAYWLTGFAFHLGGAHVIAPQEASLEGLNRLLPLIPGDEKWGIIGLAGFALSGEGVTPMALELFLSYLPMATMATLLVVLGLEDEGEEWMTAAALLFALFIWPIAACWVWGGGFLARLGQTMEVGHGFVDFGGSGLLLWLPATFLIGFLIWRERRPPVKVEGLPPVHFPLLGTLGTWLMGVGWMGWALALPFHTWGATIAWPRSALTMLLTAAGAMLTAQLYAFLAEGALEPLLSARGAAVGWGAALAAAPFLTPTMALVTGLIAGLLLPFALHLSESGLRLRAPALTVALGLVGGGWGLLSVAFFAAGRWGEGWNGIGGAVGSLIGGDGGQIAAQLAGLVILGVWGGGWGSVLGLLPRLWRRLHVPPAEPPSSADEESAEEHESAMGEQG